MLQVFTPKQIKLIRQQQKLLAKLEKKTKREAERRKMQEERKRRREEDEQRRKEGRKRGKKTKATVKVSHWYHQLTLSLSFTVISLQERQRYFGSPLQSVVGEDGVPVFIKKCVEVVESHGLKSEGIYRVSGKKEDCLELQEKFDEGRHWVSTAP